MPNKPFPDNVITVAEAAAKIPTVFAHPDIRVTRMVVETVTAQGSTMRLTWDHKNVGQEASRSFTLADVEERHPHDPAFNQVVKDRLSRG